MRISLNPVNLKGSKYSVEITAKDSVQKMGSIEFDKSQKQWIANGSLVRCLELLTSGEKIRQGYLGNDLQKASRIVFEVVGAWYLLTNDSMAKNPISIHKLDLPADQEPLVTIDPYKDFRPLSDSELTVA